ncbi:hypothetical protein CVT26_011383 [Gymnopilus dilepis]|uniref:Uncharacterized protein n=1 Tax=Gymnopilus dilepis TaxID=231916 RepID=A0A409YHH0_9AGAR|nr:hypothetical protein CVT26_011383 [Gymnopilus dilepis]
MAAKFLCCLPLRLGVVIISVLQFLFCGAFAGVLWWAICFAHKDQSDLAAVTGLMKTTAIIVAAVYSAAALIALFGFLGSIFRKLRLVQIFSLLLFLALLVQIGSSIWYLVIFYRNRHQNTADCKNGTTDPNRIAYCDSLDAFRRIPQGAMLASFIVTIVLQAYACYVVHYYSKRLENQRAERRASRALRASGPVYQPVEGHEDAFTMSKPANQYPYADTAHSYGHAHQPSYGDNDAGRQV